MRGYALGKGFQPYLRPKQGSVMVSWAQQAYGKPHIARYVLHDQGKSFHRMVAAASAAHASQGPSVPSAWHKDQVRQAHEASEPRASLDHRASRHRLRSEGPGERSCLRSLHRSGCRRRCLPFPVTRAHRGFRETAHGARAVRLERGDYQAPMSLRAGPRSAFRLASHRLDALRGRGGRVLVCAHLPHQSQVHVQPLHPACILPRQRQADLHAFAGQRLLGADGPGLGCTPLAYPPPPPSFSLLASCIHPGHRAEPRRDAFQMDSLPLNLGRRLPSSRCSTVARRAVHPRLRRRFAHRPGHALRGLASQGHHRGYLHRIRSNPRAQQRPVRSHPDSERSSRLPNLLQMYGIADSARASLLPSAQYVSLAA